MFWGMVITSFRWQQGGKVISQNDFTGGRRMKIATYVKKFRPSFGRTGGVQPPKWGVEMDVWMPSKPRQPVVTLSHSQIKDDYWQHEDCSLSKPNPNFFLLQLIGMLIRNVTFTSTTKIWELVQPLKRKKVRPWPWCDVNQYLSVVYFIYVMLVPFSRSSGQATISTDVADVKWQQAVLEIQMHRRFQEILVVSLHHHHAPPSTTKKILLRYSEIPKRFYALH